MLAKYSVTTMRDYAQFKNAVVRRNDCVFTNNGEDQSEWRI